MPENKAEFASEIRAVATRLVRNLRQKHEDNTYSHVDLLTLSLIHEHGSLLPSELAQLERVSAQAISQVVQKLHDEGCIKKTSDKNDKRKTTLSLTAKGKQILDKVWEQKNEWLVHAIDDLFSEKEIILLEKALPLLKRLSEHDK
jgi:DNA-binding MarR family transcriptional regulator